MQDQDDLRQWLAGKPPELAALIASRAVLRVLPGVVPKISVYRVEQRLQANLLQACAMLIVLARSGVSHPDRSASRRLHATLAGLAANAFDDAGHLAHGAADVASAAMDASTAAVDSTEPSSAAAAGASQAASAAFEFAADDADYSDPGPYNPANEAMRQLWSSISYDCQWCDIAGDGWPAMYAKPLWLKEEPAFYRKAASRLHAYWRDDPESWSQWNRWYDRRREGQPSEWGLPEPADREMAKRLIEADEDFWKRGEEDPAFVNRQLGEWLAELRLPIEAPAQDPSVTVYITDDRGRVIRAPSPQQQHLKDTPDQRRKYADLRADVLEMLEDTPKQQLGPRLSSTLEGFADALVADFDQAEAYPIWRGLRKLDSLARKDAIAREAFDPSERIMDDSCAEDVRQILQQGNNFAFADDSIRANDERSISPQRRAEMAPEADVGRPLAEALAQESELVDEGVSSDLIEGIDTIDEAGNDPVSNQIVERTLVQRRNVFAALLTRVRDVLAKQVSQTSAEVRKGIEQELGRKGVDYLLRNRSALSDYAQQAYGAVGEQVMQSIGWFLTLIS